VKTGTNQSCPGGGGKVCNVSSGGGGSGSGGGQQTYVVPILPPSACGLWLQCSYTNGVATVSVVNSSGRPFEIATIELCSACAIAPLRSLDV
jgi:hypothetical protein